MCDEVRLLGASRATLRTSTSPEVWRPVLDGILRSDPDCSILQVRWRQSRHGGRQWTGPEATPQQLGAVRRLARLPPPTALVHQTEAELELVLRGRLGARPREVLSAVMQVLQCRTGLALHEVTHRPSAPRCAHGASSQRCGGPHGPTKDEELNAVKKATLQTDAIRRHNGC